MAGAAKKRAKQARNDKHDTKAQDEAAAGEGGYQRQQVAGFDGPADNRTDSSAGQPEGSRDRAASEQPGYQSGPESRAPSAVHPVLRDPARVPSYNKNIDLPGNAFNLFSQYEIPTVLVRRPGFNTSGKAINVAINSFPVVQFPNRTVYQYDITIGNGVEKRGLVKKVWECNTLKQAIGPGWVFDGNKIAWSMKSIDQEFNMNIDMDAEQGRTNDKRSNFHRVVMRKTNVVNLAAVEAYLTGKMSFDSSVLEAISFFDHLMREMPSSRLIAIKRSFFDPKVARESLGGGVEALKGVYQSIRAAQGGRLVVNVDVSNSTFWGNWYLHVIAIQLTGAPSYPELGDRIKKKQNVFEGPFVESQIMRDLKRLKKCRFTVKHRGNNVESKPYTIKDFSYKNAHEWKFDLTERETGKTIPQVSIYDYFIKKYNIRLQHATLPIVETTRKGVAFPMEVCTLQDGQRFNFKLNELQTTKMIKFAVTRPQGRLQSINAGLALLDWQNDKYLKNYGLKIQGEMLRTQARLLSPPQVQFANKSENPGVSGRWRLDGKKFLSSNKYDLISWGVCIMNNFGREKIQVAQAEAFIRSFVQTYKGHGGTVVNSNPPVIMGEPDTAKAVAALFNTVGNKYNARPQMLVFLLAGKDAFQYLRLKKSCDCRFGVVSQCMQNAHVLRAQAQYMSNVCMKFNAKLGGTTARAASPNNGMGKNAWGHFKRPTIIIGADVSHASPGSMQASMAAITVSLDRQCLRYGAACQTNGHRVEIITAYNIESLVEPFAREWMMTAGQGRFPSHCIYFRDGVSEGQYQHVLQQEVRDLRRVFNKLASENNVQKPTVEVTVIIASKRHHIRFFPEKGPGSDMNMNPNPGTLVEKDVTHPFEYDFYLNSHSAIQGTARPTHYHVLMDEAKMAPNDLQSMIYEHCYQYIRSTTPVSLFPAVYYAHLASNRARSHEDIAASAGPHTRKEEMEAHKKVYNESSSDRPPTEFKPLIKMEKTNKINWSMWYI